MKRVKLLIVSFLIGLCPPVVQAQIGINTLTPDTSAALHVVSKPYGQGLLMPKLFQARRGAITTPARGLLTYDLTNDLFYFNRSAGSSNWFALNPWLSQGDSITARPLFTHSIVSRVGIGISTPSQKLHVVGSIRSTDTLKADRVVATSTLAVAGFPVNAVVPAGVIVMWSSYAGGGIPNGWALCDGSAGTPDLRGRFVVGYDPGAATAPAGGTNDGVTKNYGTIGNTGGETGHTLIKQELPKHKHFVGNGTDGASLSNSGNHQHNYQARDGNGHETGNATNNLGYQTYATDPAGDHSHSGISGDGTGDGLNAQIHENRPPFYVLAFIMKLP